MTCDAIRELFSDLLEGALSSADRARVENHCAGCPDCRELLALMGESRTALASFPEVGIDPGLLAELYAVPEAKKPFFVRMNRFFIPKLQPALAVLSAVLIMVSMYAFHPDRKLIDRSINRRLHLAYSQVERLYARAEGLTGRLGGMTSSVLDSVKGSKLLGGDEGRKQ